MDRLGPLQPAPDDLERAVRLLAVRSRRDVTGLFAGGYRSAFRGGGFEFEESRPYAPGDDVRGLDWNAMARTGTPWVKRFREERDQTLVLALDISASMAFGSAGRSKHRVASHAAALLAAAAARAGDRVGVLRFDHRVHRDLLPARGEAQLWRVLRVLAAPPTGPRRRTDLAAALAGIRDLAGRRSVVVVLSDFRDDSFFEDTGRGRGALVALTRRHDVVAAVLHDPREDAIPAVGSVRIADPERGGRPLLLRSNRPESRERYRLACLARRRALERRLRSDGADLLWLPTHHDPLRALARFFRRHHGLAARTDLAARTRAGAGTR